MQSALNKIFIIGQVIEKPKLQQIHSYSGPQCCCDILLATQRKLYKDGYGYKSEIHQAVAWNKTAESIVSAVDVDNTIYIEGSLQTINWDDQDGIRQYKTLIYICRYNILIDEVKYVDGYRVPNLEFSNSQKFFKNLMAMEDK